MAGEKPHIQALERAQGYLKLRNEVVRDYPEQQLDVILDKLSTHKPKRDRWLARHNNVHLHFTPTHASWLNVAPTGDGR